MDRRIDHANGTNGSSFSFLSLSPVSAQLHSLIQLLPPSFSLSPTASGRGWPPATSSNGSEPAGARRRWPEVDLALAVEAAAWTLGAATSSSWRPRRVHSLSSPVDGSDSSAAAGRRFPVVVASGGSEPGHGGSSERGRPDVWGRGRRLKIQRMKKKGWF
jgi:hypothetical protein